MTWVEWLRYLAAAVFLVSLLFVSLRIVAAHTCRQCGGFGRTYWCSTCGRPR